METVDPVAELARGFGRCYTAKYTLLLTVGAKRSHHVKGLTKETCVCVRVCARANKDKEQGQRCRAFLGRCPCNVRYF